MFDVNAKPQGLKRLYLAGINSFRAIRWLYKNESAFKQELLMLIVAIPISFWFEITFSEQLILILALLFVVFTEIINTAIEAVVDRIGLDIHPLSGLAKDLGSAAVLLSIVMAMVVWWIILI